MTVAKVQGIITKRRKYKALKIQISFPGCKSKFAEQLNGLRSTTPGTTRIAPNASATQAVHTTTTDMMRCLNFTVLFEPFIIMTTTTAKTAINADLSFPPIAMIARKIL